MKFPKISFITTCMGRLHHLVETLPKNIIWNMNYPNVEFLLLDYNSPDGLETWMKKYMINMIDQGLLIYYRNPEPEFYHFTHSRNMLIKLADGDIVCNLDADNYTGENFAFFIAENILNVDFLKASLYYEDDNSFNPLAIECHGRIVVKRNILLNVGGYYESLGNWGSDDMDLINRLEKFGYSSQFIPSEYLRCICHSNKERGLYSKIKDAGCLTESHRENMLKSQENIEKGGLIVNDGHFGKGIVYKNFNSVPIEVL